MKLLATLATVVLSLSEEESLQCIQDGDCWPGSNDHRGAPGHTFNTCGMQIHKESGFTESMVNSTCTWSGSNVRHVYAGNGAFITGENEFTGYEGISGDVNLVVFFDQDCLDEECDELANSTGVGGDCYDFSVSCQDNGVATTGQPFFMEVVNDGRQANGTNFNLQIANAQDYTTLTIQLMDRDNNPWNAKNIRVPEPFGVSNVNAGNTFIVTLNNPDHHMPFGQLFQIFITDDWENNNAEYPLDLWKSTVSGA